MYGYMAFFVAHPRPGGSPHGAEQAEDLQTIKQHVADGNAVTVITADVEKPDGYGRIIRTENGISGIVEERDATAKQKKITEINVNSGVNMFT